MSAVQEAIEAVLATVPIGDRVDLLDLSIRLANVVEAIPVQVTIRDLDMTDSENIIVVDGDALLTVSNAARDAYDQGSYLNITVDNADLKLKVGNGTWCPPIQTEVYGR